MKNFILDGLFVLFSRQKKLLIIMKLMLLFTLVGTMGLSAASSYSQETRLTLKLENVSINELLKEIGKKTEFSFWYNNNERLSL